MVIFIVIFMNIHIFAHKSAPSVTKMSSGFFRSLYLCFIFLASSNAGASRPTSLTSKRGRQEKRREAGTEQTIPRTFSTGAADVLNWQVRG